MYFGPASYTLLMPEVEVEEMQMFYYLDVEVG